MKERPILFSAPMVRALLAGTKTQTRRLCGDRVAHFEGGWWTQKLGSGSKWESGLCSWHCPYGKPGDRLWVRETFAYSVKDPCGLNETIGPETHDIVCKEGSHGGQWEHTDESGARTMVAPRWKPGIHMPRWASRITLEVTEVRVQRLQDISDEDAKAEGAPALPPPGSTLPHGPGEPSHAVGFRHLWCTINGTESWDANPWVWAVGFKRLAAGSAAQP